MKSSTLALIMNTTPKPRLWNECCDTVMNELINKSEKIAMSNKKEKHIEKRIYVRGMILKNLTETQMMDMIRKENARIKSLIELNISSMKVQKRIKECNEVIKLLTKQLEK